MVADNDDDDDEDEDGVLDDGGNDTRISGRRSCSPHRRVAGR